MAKDLLYDKVDNPWAAAIGGYVLMRGGQLGRLRSWIARLDSDFPWLPDGLKHACQRRPHDDALAAALARVQEVASCAIWRSPLTCCYGAEPSQPERGLRYQGVAAVTVNLGST